MTGLITAEEARGLDPALKTEAAIERLDKLIRAAAEKGYKMVRVPHDMTESNGYNIKFSDPGVEEALMDAGFSVMWRSEERQFVDIWMEIEWGKSA